MLRLGWERTVFTSTAVRRPEPCSCARNVSSTSEAPRRARPGWAATTSQIWSEGKWISSRLRGDITTSFTYRYLPCWEKSRETGPFVNRLLTRILLATEPFRDSFALIWHEESPSRA